MNEPNVLIIADEKDCEIIDTASQSAHWNIFWEIIDYNELHKKVGEIQGLLTKNDIDFVLFSRNDQVLNRTRIGPVIRKLRIGYSSFSGIDKKDTMKQMRECFEAFIKCKKRLNFKTSQRERNVSGINYKGGTFSLIFDEEQLGGVKYGLPRIFDVLNKYAVSATFFVTNLMKKVFSNIVEEIRSQGHEVGLHGMWHEYLSDLNKEEQIRSIQDMVQDFGGEVLGANFIGRMNIDTIQALAENKLEYLIYPAINYYHFASYPKLTTAPGLITFLHRNIWALPISVETYGLPWFSIKNMIDSALLQSKKCRFLHISILCHSFRDGNLANIETIEKLLCHLVKKGLTPITLIELVKMMQFGTDSPKIQKMEDLFKPTKTKLSLPSTKQDFIGIAPENLMNIFRIFHRDRATF